MALNIYDLPNPLPAEELFTDLIQDRGVKIERIVSTGQSTPEGEWYDQPRDEWVALSRARPPCNSTTALRQSSPPATTCSSQPTVATASPAPASPHPASG